MSKVRIVNWILTRKCNLKCDYCAIVKDYSNKPDVYPNMSHYIKNEMPTELVIAGLRAFKVHNPHMFHIFYGGEPLLRKDLPLIINYCNDNEIAYTIISNNTKEIQTQIKRLNKNPRASNEGVRIYQILRDKKQLDEYTNAGPYDWASKPRGLQYNSLSKDQYDLCEERIDDCILVYLAVDYNVTEIFHDKVDDDMVIWRD